MPFRLERGAPFAGESLGLDFHAVGPPLVMVARRLRNGRQIHARRVQIVQHSKQHLAHDAGAPSTSTPFPSSTKVGVMLDSGRLPGATAFATPPRRRNEFGTSASSVKSSISLLSSTPVPRPTT